MKIKTAASIPLYYSVTAAVIIFSYFSFSYPWYPFFNSDAALSVLMSYDYHFPADLYCWGQDRGGTLEMMLAHIFIFCFHTGPLLTASVVHYLLLAGGLLASFHFVKKPFYRFALAVLWFFPSRFFIDTILYQFGIQFSIFMMALFFFSKAMQHERRKLLWLSISFLLMILNIWVLDLGIIPVFLLFAFMLYHFLSGKKESGSYAAQLKAFFSKNGLLLFTAWAAAGAWFIVFAKGHATGFNSFPETSLNSFAGIVEVLGIAAGILKANFLMQGNPAQCLYLYASTIFLVLLTIQPGKEKNGLQSFFRKYFLYGSLAGIFILLLLKQVLVSGLPARYFAGCYLSFSLFAVMKLEADGARPLLRLSLVLLLACSAASALYENYIPERLRPMVKNFQRLQDLKPVGIIGSYWNAYVFSAIDPVQIKATPHDRDNVRNAKAATETLEQPRILLIQNEWLEHFPDTVTQFGVPLKKSGDPFLLGTYVSWQELNEVMACEYAKTP